MDVGLRRLRRRARAVGLRLGVVPYEPAVWNSERWESEYGSGTLDYFGSIVELARYSVLVGYLGHVGRGGRLLDVGCGQGLLRSRIPDEWVGEYVGVDPTVEAVAQAEALGAPRSRFVVGTVADAVGDGPFDVTFCNEVLSVVPEPAALADALVDVTRPGGHVLTSIWRHPGDTTLWKLLEQRLELVDAVEVKNRANRFGPDGWRVACHRRG